MRILIITQDEPFYLSDNIDYLLANLPIHAEVVGCCLFDASPFGKKETFLQKALKTYRIFGSGFFVHYTLRFLLHKIMPSKQVHHSLQKHGVPIIQLENGINDAASIELLKSFQPDLLVSIVGNQIFKRPVIDLAPNGCLNLHTSLLPKYRGLMPTFWVLKNNESETGVSVFFVDEAVDSGPIIVQERVVIGDLSQEGLIRATKKIGMDAIIKSINLIESGNYTLIENDASKKSYFSFPTKVDVKEFHNLGKRFY
ncbi:Fmt Methionyl-tRNA formyltransferase [Methylophilaceae bacterium]